MQCNIDARGKAGRLIIGALFEGVGLFLLVLAWVGVLGGIWPWYLGVPLVILGWIGIFEGIAGWCAIRALGI